MVTSAAHQQYSSKLIIAGPGVNVSRSFTPVKTLLKMPFGHRQQPHSMSSNPISAIFMLVTEGDSFLNPGKMCHRLNNEVPIPVHLEP